MLLILVYKCDDTMSTSGFCRRWTSIGGCDEKNIGKKSHPIHVSVQTKLEFNTKWLQEKLQNMSGDILMTKNEEYDVYVMIIRRHRTIVLRTLFKKFTSKYCKMKYNVKYIAIC